MHYKIIDHYKQITMSISILTIKVYKFIECFVILIKYELLNIIFILFMDKVKNNLWGNMSRCELTF